MSAAVGNISDEERSITPVESAESPSTKADMGTEKPPPGYEEANTLAPANGISYSAQTNGEVKVPVEEPHVNGEAVKDKNGVPMSFENPAYHEEGKNGKAGKSDPDGKKDKDEKKEEEKLEMVSLVQLFRYADGLDLFLMIIGTLCACLHGAALPCLMIVFGDMTDSFVTSGIPVNITMSGGTAAPMVNPEDTLLEEMKGFSIYYIILACAVLVVAYGQVTCFLITSYRQALKVRHSLFQAILRQEIGWFDTHEPGELNTRLSDDVNKIQEGLGDKIGNFFQWFSTFLAGIVIGFVYGWKLALVILAVSPLLALCGGVMGRMTTAFTSKELAAYAKAGAVAEEVLGAIRTVMAFGGQTKEHKRYTTNLKDAESFGIKKSAIGGLAMGLIFLIIFCTYALAFWYGSKLVREDDAYTAGRMLIVFFSVLIGAFAIGNAGPNIQNVSTARGAAYIIWNLVDRKSLIDSSSEEGKKPDHCYGNIEFKNVFFKYPSRMEVQVLSGLSVKVDVGQTVALVGSSGCGKSTTVSLLQRFYDTLEGQVTIDGVDIKDLNIKWLRQHIGVVSQEPVLFGTTIEENIRYGREGVTKEEIEKACREANAFDFISALPQKLNTLVGERGAQLSGGQKQRIAIARALVRDPKILLLDEATSALDFESEASVQAALDKARTGRTTLVIAHRLSTVRNADVIVGLKNGVVHEQGSHEELMKQNGIYYTLCTHQTQMDANGEEMFDDDVLFAKRDINDLEEEEPTMERRSSVRISHHGKLNRGQSVVSRQMSVAKADDDEKLPDPPMSRVMRMNAPETGYIIVGCVASIVVGAVQPVFAVLFSEIIGVFAEQDLDVQARKIGLYSAMFVVIGVVSGLFMFLQAYMFGTSGERLTTRIRSMAFESLLRQDIAYFDDHRNAVGALTTRLATDASAVQGATGARFGTAFQSFASIGTGIIIGFVYSWKLTLGILAFVPFIVVSGFLQMKLMQGYSSEGRAALEGAGKVAIEAIENMRTVACLTKEEEFAKKYYNLLYIPHKRAVNKAHLSGITFSFTQAIIFFAYAAAFYLGAYLIKNDGLEFVNMFKVFSAIVFGAMAIGQASSFAPDYGKAKAAAAKLFQLFDSTPTIDISSTEGIKLESLDGVVEFKDAQFHYPTRQTVQVLKGLDLEVRPGQQVALVGSSGCGKSTTIQLLERLYDPIEGSVKLDGHELKSLNIQYLRSQMGLVSQEPILFDSSIKYNIAYGDNSREVGMDEVIEAARKANIHSFIETLPDGYDTNVGDKGTQLSGGQKQRIAIARALLRNPKILLLDEATSALDTESEKVVQEALENAQRGRTSIVIAHRLSTIQNADVIFVIHHGKVAEKGTHTELMSKQGLYYKLQLTQAKK